MHLLELFIRLFVSVVGGWVLVEPLVLQLRRQVPKLGQNQTTIERQVAERLARLIGFAERAITTSLVVWGTPQQTGLFIGGWVALKTAGSWGLFKEPQHHTQRAYQIYLLGNALSFSCAIAAGGVSLSALRAVVMAIDPTTVSTANAASAALGIAQQQVWASWAAAGANVAVVITAAVLTIRESRRSRKARLRSASMGLHHAVEVTDLFFRTLRKQQFATPLDIEDAIALVQLGKEAVDAVATGDLEDDNLRMLAVNARTAIGSIAYGLSKIAREQRKPTIGEYLAETVALEKSVGGILKAVDENWSQIAR